MDDSLLVTEPFARHLKECQDIIDFTNTIWGTAFAYDQMVIKQVISPLPDYTKVDENALHEAVTAHLTAISGCLNSDKVAALRLSEHRQLQFQMLHSRVVDNFIAYLSELTAAVYHKQPNLLKSEQTITAEFVLQYETMEEFVAALAEKRVQDLLYKSVKELAKTLSKAWNIELFEDEQALEGVVYAVEVRNIIVHNRAVVNQVFLNRLRGLSFFHSLSLKKGDQYPLDAAPVVQVLKFLLVSGARIDRIVAAKFGLPTQVAPLPKAPFNFPET